MFRNHIENRDLDLKMKTYMLDCGHVSFGDQVQSDSFIRHDPASLCSFGSAVAVQTKMSDKQWHESNP